VIVFDVEVEGGGVRLDLREGATTAQIVGPQADVATYPEAVAEEISTLAGCVAHGSPFLLVNRTVEFAGPPAETVGPPATEESGSDRGIVLLLSLLVGWILVTALVVRTSKRSAYGFASAAVIGGVIVGLVCAEMVARSANLSLPIQAVNESQSIALVGDRENLHWLTLRSEHDRRFDGCSNEESRPRVVLQGSSILWGSGIAAEDSFGPRLQEALLAEGLSEVCVVNHAQPASTYSIQRAALATAEPIPGEILLWELWDNSPNPFVRIGDTAYNFGSMDVRSDGIPDPFGMGVLARPLLIQSRLYEWFALHRMVKETRPRGDSQSRWNEFAPVFVGGALKEAERRGAQLVVVTFPSLDRPFAEQREHNAETYGPVLSVLRERGVPVIEMDRALVGHDHESVRHDPCCHYNSDGAKVVSEILAERLAPLLSTD
jgi:hypothetical protein